MKKKRLMFVYHDMVKIGNFTVANKILRLLIKKKIALSLNDDDWEIERLAEKLNLSITYSRNFNVAYVRL